MIKLFWKIFPVIFISNLKIIHREINIYIIIITNSIFIFLFSILKNHFQLNIYNEIIMFFFIYNISFIITDLFFECDRLFIPYRIYPISILFLLLVKNIVVIFIYFLLLLTQLSINFLVFSFTLSDVISSLIYTVFNLPPILLLAIIYSLQKQINLRQLNIIKSSLLFLTLLVFTLVYIIITRTFHNNMLILFISFLFISFLSTYLITKIIRSRYSKGFFYV